jgi:hypothetical protein
MIAVLAHKEMVYQQFAPIVRAGMTTLSNTFLFLVSQMFHAMAMKIAAHSTLCAGCTNLGLVIESWTDLNPCIFWILNFLHRKEV